MQFDPSLLVAQSQPAPLLQFIDNLARTPLSQVLMFVAVCTLIRLAIFPTLTKTAPHKRFGSYKVLKFVNESTDALVYAGVIVFLVIRPFGIQTFFIPSQSMENTLMTKDFIVANKFIYRFSEPVAGDITVFRPPQRGLLEGQGQTDYIKRCVGTPGQVIEIREGRLYRDGKLVDEPYVTKGNSNFDFKLVKDGEEYVPCLINPLTGDVNVGPMPIAPDYRADEDPERAARLRNLPPVAVPPGSLLMMGDNRNESYDGRCWGLADRRNLIGKSEFIWLPLNRARQTR